MWIVRLRPVTDGVSDPTTLCFMTGCKVQNFCSFESYSVASCKLHITRSRLVVTEAKTAHTKLCILKGFDTDC